VIDDLHSEWSRLFVRSLADAGVRDFVVSPGSRSTPLALAVAAESSLRATAVVDERSAGFFALGQARVTGRPSVLLCTSGSAGAHYFPALLEAERARTPVIIVTADRPWDLTRAHANQTLDQGQLFGSHARAFFELGLPEPAALGAVPRIAAQAVLAATTPVAGPVHLNARFRKPLEPVASNGDETWRSRLSAIAKRGAPELHPPTLSPSRAAVERLAELCAGARRGLVVAGPFLGVAGEPRTRAARRLRAALARFLAATGFGLAAEAASGVLYGAELDGIALGGFDAWLPAAFRDPGPPDLVIEIGSPPTSGTWLTELEHRLDALRVVVSSDGIPDPAGTANVVLQCEAADLLERVMPALPTRAPDSVWLDALVRQATAHQERLGTAAEELTEPGLARALIRALPDSSTLVLGNSQVVRDVDVFGGRTSHDVTVLHQRGLSGIDGIIAGAFGARSVTPNSSAVVALLGDVSALHDVGSLALASDAEGPLLLVVVNNGGGRIFEQLPIAKSASPDTFRKLFLTPPPAFLGDVARAFEIAHRCVRTRDELSAALGEGWGAGTTLLEVVVSPDTSRIARGAAREALPGGAA